jgi:Collagen triple helix repeat (20 copies)
MTIKRLITKRVRAVLGAATVAGIVGGVAIATGSIPDSAGVIHGCRASAGALRVIDDASSACTASETALAWNQQGPKGDIGPQGLRGPRGLQGLQGDPGAAGAAGATGPTGPKGSRGLQGLTGETGATGATGATGTRGPRGLQGLQGDPGPAGADGATGPAGADATTKRVYNVREVDSVTAFGRTRISIFCRGFGDKVVAGGAEPLDLDGPALVASAPSNVGALSGQEGWEVVVEDNSGVHQRLNIWVLCLEP